MAAGKKKRPGVEIARQHFLYGGVTDVMELSKLAGIHDSTVRRHVGEWEKEHAEMLIATNPRLNNNSLSVPPEVLEKHQADIDFFRERLDKTKAELSNLPSFLSEVRELVGQFASDEAKFDQGMALFDRMLRTWANEKSLTKLCMDLKSMWDSKSGIDSMKNIQEATAKAVSVASAKSEPTETGKEGPRVVNDGVFRKRI